MSESNRPSKGASQEENEEFEPSTLEAAALEAAVEDGLLPSSESKLKRAGLRRGKWTAEEEAYANRLIYEFKLGLLPLTDGTTLRTFLSKLLNCDPMRISKKFVGQNCIGKQVFRRRQQDMEKLSGDAIETSRKELADLEQKFLERVAQANRSKAPVVKKEEHVGAAPAMAPWTEDGQHAAQGQGQSAGQQAQPQQVHGQGQDARIAQTNGQVPGYHYSSSSEAEYHASLPPNGQLYHHPQASFGYMPAYPSYGTAADYQSLSTDSLFYNNAVSAASMENILRTPGGFSYAQGEGEPRNGSWGSFSNLMAVGESMENLERLRSDSDSKIKVEDAGRTRARTQSDDVGFPIDDQPSQPPARYTVPVPGRVFIAPGGGVDVRVSPSAKKSPTAHARPSIDLVYPLQDAQQPVAPPSVHPLAAAGTIKVPAVDAAALGASSAAVPRNSSVDNFWMLVNMGDLPRPDSDVLSETLWQAQAASSSSFGKGLTPTAKPSSLLGAAIQSSGLPSDEEPVHKKVKVEGEPMGSAASHHT